jgi:hypothetical protein
MWALRNVEGDRMTNDSPASTREDGAPPVDWRTIRAPDEFGLVGNHIFEVGHTLNVEKRAKPICNL